MPRVLILHTGGTLGMRGDPLQPDEFASELTDTVPEIAEIADLETRIVFNLDSSDIGPEHWTKLACEIDGARDDFDGFVIVHGTDTMAYTASALSYALLHVGKPVILTGAQRPLAALRTDARRNLVDAVELATRSIDVVGVCFDGLLLHGPRTTKSNAHDYRAFESPGAEPVARMGVDVVMRTVPRMSEGGYVFRPYFEPSVLVLHVSPGMRADLLGELFRKRRLKGLVLAAYGSGTVPTRTHGGVAEMVAKAVQEGVEVLVVTQSAGRVDLGRYENSRSLQQEGAISGGEMTIEAGVTKLMHGLATYEDRGDRKAYLLANIVGERGADQDAKN